MEIIFILKVSSAVAVRIASVDNAWVRDNSWLVESASRYFVELEVATRQGVYAHIALDARSSAINLLDSVPTCLQSRLRFSSFAPDFLLLKLFQLWVPVLPPLHSFS